MAVTLMCPNLRCREVLIVPDDARGSRVRCAYCGIVLTVPKTAGKSRSPRPAEPVSVSGEAQAPGPDKAPDNKGKK